MKHIVVIIFVFSALVVTLHPAVAQSNDCDLANLSDAVAVQAEALATASYNEVEGISTEINALINGYLENCSDTSTAETSNEALFSVQATGVVNIRSCGETTCDIVATSTSGQIYSVLAADGDWYEIDLGDGKTGFIASWLTVRGPDELIDLYEGYSDSDLVCVMQAVVSRATSSSLNFAITGSGRNEVVVDIIRPNRTDTERVWRQIPKTFVDTGNVYIDQLYLSSYWPAGSYQLSVERNGVKKIYGFDLNQSGKTTIYVICE